MDSEGCMVGPSGSQTRRCSENSLPDSLTLLMGIRVSKDLENSLFITPTLEEQHTITLS